MAGASCSSVPFETDLSQSVSPGRGVGRPAEMGLGLPRAQRPKAPAAMLWGSRPARGVGRRLAVGRGTPAVGLRCLQSETHIHLQMPLLCKFSCRAVDAFCHFFFNFQNLI